MAQHWRAIGALCGHLCAHSQKRAGDEDGAWVLRRSVVAGGPFPPRRGATDSPGQTRRHRTLSAMPPTLGVCSVREVVVGDGEFSFFVGADRFPQCPDRV